MVVERTCTQLQCQCLAVLRDFLYAYIGFQRVAGRLDVDVSVAVVGAGVCERGHVAPQVDTVIAVVELTAEAERTVYLSRGTPNSRCSHSVLLMDALIVKSLWSVCGCFLSPGMVGSLSATRFNRLLTIEL